MADVMPLAKPPTAASVPLQIATNAAKPSLRMPPSSSIQIPLSTSVRNGHLNLDVFSPINQNGSFEFDRVLKSGEVYKRSRKTKQWKKFHLVLRPNLLSIYKSPSESKLHKQLSLSDLTAATTLKDPKGRREHIFGLFSPSRNYHLQAPSEKEARLWLELIRQEARIDEEELDVFGVGVPRGKENAGVLEDGRDRFVSSSPEPMDLTSRTSTRDGQPRVPLAAQPNPIPNNNNNNEAEASGNDLAGSYSDFSDSTPVHTLAQRSSTSIPGRGARSGSSSSRMHAGSVVVGPQIPDATGAAAAKAADGRAKASAAGPKLDGDEERVVMQGYLLVLNSKRGVRSWKKLWVVLRPKKLAFYKNDEEYAARLLLPLSGILSAVEIDPVSKAKAHCLQIIAEEKSYRFCAPSEDALARWLGALKSQLAKRKEARLRKVRTEGV